MKKLMPLTIIPLLIGLGCTQGPTRVRGNFCQIEHKAVALENSESTSFKSGEEFYIPVGTFDYHSSRIYINDVERVIRVDVTHTQDEKTGEFNTNINCIGGSGVQHKMTPFVFETLVPAKVVATSNDKSAGEPTHEIEFKKVRFELSPQPRGNAWLVTTYDEENAVTESGKISDIYKDGTQSNEKMSYTKTNSNVLGDDDTLNFVTHTSLVEANRKDALPNRLIQMQVTLKKN